MKIIRGMLTVIVMALAIIIIAINDYEKVSAIMSYMLTCSGVVQILNGIDFYKQGRKRDSILMFIFSILLLGFIVKFYIL